MKLRFARLFFFLKTAVVVLLVSTPAWGVDWYQEYNTKYPQGIAPIKSETNLGWGDTYSLRSFLHLYRTAKARGESQAEQQKWIDRLVEHCDAIVEGKFRGRSSDGEIYLVLEGHGFSPVAEFVRLVFENEALYAQHKAKANKYLNYLETVIVPAWRTNDYWNTPHNWYLSYGVVLMHLAQASLTSHYAAPDYTTPDPTLAAYYVATVKEMATKYFGDTGWTFTNKWWKESTTEKTGLCYYAPADAYIWRYMDPDPTARPEDIGHANIEVEFVVETKQASLFSSLYSAQTLQRITNTFLKVLWSNKPEANNPAFRSHLEPEGAYGSLDEDDEHVMRWLWLYSVDPQVGDLVQSFYQSHTEFLFSESLAILAAWQSGLPIYQGVAPTPPAPDAGVAEASAGDAKADAFVQADAPATTTPTEGGVGTSDAGVPSATSTEGEDSGCSYSASAPGSPLWVLSLLLGLGRLRRRRAVSVENQ